MNSLQIVLFVCAFVACVASELATNCDPKKCVLPTCRCSDVKPPAVTGSIPQLVSISFDDSASQLVYDEFYKKLLLNRKNPDNCPISGTMYVTHEYTDYRVVNELHRQGFEIGSHSITKNFSISYWNTASEKTIVDEMGGQKTIIAKFANISKDVIIGARIPHFQLNANNTFKGLKNAGFVYDHSWPTYSFAPYFPYTLDYASTQSCLVGKCPNESVTGMWVQPIINWVDMEKAQCNKIQACVVNGTAKQIFEWMKTNFDRHYTGTRVPFNMLLNYAWFNFVENSFDALKLFLDHLQTYKDVFIVSQRQVLNWIQKPVNTTEFSSCVNIKPATCSPVTCKLRHEDGGDRYMGSCVPCPKNYPSLSNPEGK